MAAPAILQYISDRTYPESEAISSTDLSSNDLSTLLESLREQQNTTRASISSLSRSAAGDIDTWIAQAKALQNDIIRSRETARQIVADAEAGKTLQNDVLDQSKKVSLLEREVEFNETLTGTLEHIRYAQSLLEKTQEEAVVGNISTSLERLDDAEASILALSDTSRAAEVLRERAEALKADMRETATECWNAFLIFDFEEARFEMRKKGLQADVPDATVPEIPLEGIVLAVKGLGIFDELVAKLSQDLEQVILRRRLIVDDEALVAKVKGGEWSLDVGGKRSGDLSHSSLFKDLGAIFEFIHTRLPSSITLPLSQTLVPALSALFEQHWLEPAIPLVLSEVSPFTTIIEDLEQLLDLIEGYGWKGTDGLRDWIESAPGLWLTTQREAVLGEVRNLVFTGGKERKIVERVETRVVEKQDVGAVKSGSSGDGGDEEDEWDGAWDEEQEAADSKPNQVGHKDDEDDEASAWDLDADEVDQKDTTADEEGEDEWGAWGDEPTSTPPSPVLTKSQPVAKPNGDTPSSPQQPQELTLRESLTVTSIPSALLQILQRIISDAETLSSDEYASSPLASAARGLYQLPTLALAIYRATAPTTYSKLDVGNMLIYNDSLHLADLLRTWSDSRSADAGRLRLDNDLAALESFGKKAYSSEMESQRTILRDILDGAQGFVRSDKAPWKAECEGAVEGVVARMRDVQGLWRGVLSEGALLQSLGSLLGTVTSKVVSEIEDLGDISEAESKQLKALCDKITELKDIFAQQQTTGDNGEAPRDMTFIYCPTWLKFQYLAEILESNLADIKWMWKEGELKLEFTAEEVVELIEALFAESELRRGAVREIRRGG